MDLLSEGFVEKTWQQVAEFTPDRANKEMIAMGKNQPDLLAFLMAYTDDLQQEVKELAIYIAFVVYNIKNSEGQVYTFYKNIVKPLFVKSVDLTLTYLFPKMGDNLYEKIS